MAKVDKKDVVKELSKEAGIDDDILTLLRQKKQRKEYLDIGFSEEKNIFWYGFLLNGREAIIKVDQNHKGKVLRNTLEKVKTEGGDSWIGENQIKKYFDYGGFIGDIAPIIANETIEYFVFQNEKGESPKDIYAEVRDKILYYMDFGEQDEIADVLTCWIIATYCYVLFYWFPHTLFNAPSKSGKSKCAEVVSKLSFRGFDAGASGGITPAQLYKTLEGNRGTIILDEYERNDDFQKVVNQILNASCSKNSFIIRNVQKGRNSGWNVEKFSIFSPKIACNISGINPTSLSRFIAFKWLASKGIQSSKKPQKRKDTQELEALSQKLYLFMLNNIHNIKQIADDLDISDLFKGRNEDNWFSLFTIARFVDQSKGKQVNAEAQLNKFVKNYKEIEIETDDLEEEFFRTLLEQVSDKDEYETPTQIAGYSLINDLLDGAYKKPANFIGRMLKKYKFKSNRGGGRKKYLISKPRVKEIIKLYWDQDDFDNK